MNAEDRWAQECEWKEEKGEIEIKWESQDMGPSIVLCEWLACPNPSVKTFEVGPVIHHHGVRFDLCADHANDDDAFIMYRAWKP